MIASTGTAVVGARNLLNIQAERARSVIPKSWDVPPGRTASMPRAAGRCAAGTATPLRPALMVFGDSTATGYGCRDADEVPGC